MVLWTALVSGAPGRRYSRAVLQAGRSQAPGAPPPLHRLPGREGRLRPLCPQPCSPRAMEPSGSLFPSLVVVGHVVTLAAVWHWRRGRWRGQEVQGKRLWQLPSGPRLGSGLRPPPLSWGLEAGQGEGPPPSNPCISLCPPLPVPELRPSTAHGGRAESPPPHPAPLPSISSAALKTLPAFLGWSQGSEALSVWSPVLVGEEEFGEAPDWGREQERSAPTAREASAQLAGVGQVQG